MDWEALLLTAKLSTVSTGILFIIALPLSLLLSRGSFRGKAFIEAAISLPSVLPQVVLGFYLLLLFSPNSFFGSMLERVFHLRLAFTFEGLVLASCVLTFPLMVMQLKTGFEQVNRRLLETSWLLGNSRLATIWKVTLPNSRSAIIAALATTFAHVTGAFGIVLMVGGNIPGETRVASVAIYEGVETLNYTSAHLSSLCLLLVSFSVLLLLNGMNNRKKRTWTSA